MYCVHCGGQVNYGQIFCSKCGQRIGSATATDFQAQPVIPAQPSIAPTGTPPTSSGTRDASRVARNLTSLGALWIIYCALRLMSGIGLFALGHFNFPFILSPFPFSRHFFAGPFLGVMGLFVSFFALAGIIAGWGLMSHQPWARVLAIIMGFIYLIHIPFGTALGIYTFWVLLADGAEEEYDRLAQAH